MALAVLLLLVLALYLLRIDEVCGAYVDDGWYVLLARALAAGHGYTIDSAPTPGMRPVYPPGFPLLLSVVFHLVPRFPENIPLLKGVSVAAMLGVGGMTWLHARRVLRLPVGIALAVMLATVLHPAFVFLATSTVMSECVFALMQLAAVVLVERGLHGDDAAASTRVTFAGGLVAGFAVLVRGLGVALVVAGAAFLARQRRWRGLVAFLGGAVLLLGPWILHGRLHPPLPAQQLELNDYAGYGYATHFWMLIAGNPQFGTAGVADLPGRAWRCALHLLRFDVGALLVYPAFRLAEPATFASGIAAWAPGVSIAGTVLVVLGWGVQVWRRAGFAEFLVPATVGICLLWPFPPFRFVLPLLPFVLGYVTSGVGALAALGRVRTGSVLAAVAASLAVVSLGGDLAYLRQQWGPPESRPAWNRGHQEQRDVAGWIRDHTRSDEVVACSMPALIHLYAGRRTVGYFEPSDAPATWRRLDVRYLALTDASVARGGLAGRPVLYRTPDAGFGVIGVGTSAAAPR